MRDENVTALGELSIEGQANASVQTDREIRLEVRDLNKSYGSRLAVSGVSFGLTNGVTALVGPNGAGKTTIIRCIVGILDWNDGEISVDGRDVRTRPRAARARIGYMPERVAFPPEMRVRSYLDYAARLKGVKRPDRNAVVEQALNRVDLEHVADRVINNLSKGYRQRVGLAQALVGDPAVVVLDEPTAGLDPLTVWDVRDVLWEFGKDHVILLATHVLPEARVLCERVLVIAAGNLVFDGSLVDAELTGSVTRRWRLGVSGPDLATITPKVKSAGAKIVHATGSGTSTSLVIDADKAAVVDRLVRAILSEGWSLAHLEPMTDLLDTTLRKAGLKPRRGGKGGAGDARIS